jgi:CID domain
MADTVPATNQEVTGDGPLESGPEEVIDVDEEDIIDDEQVDEFKEQLEALGSFPVCLSCYTQLLFLSTSSYSCLGCSITPQDKVMINTLSMIAADYRDSKISAAKLFSVWKHRLLTCNNVQEKMPIIYVLDSILKNVQGAFIQIVEEDVPYQWLSATYHILPTVQQQKLYKVYMTWKEYNIFSSIEKWNRMGQCFLPSSAPSASSMTAAASSHPAIPRNSKDGTLILAKNVRQEMQNILDDMQTDVVNELDKVSLERLADINPELLMNIKRAAEDGIHLLSAAGASNPSTNTTVPTRASNQKGNTSAAAVGSKPLSNPQQPSLPSFLVETRSASAVQRSNEWHNLLSQQNKSPLGPVASGPSASMQSNAMMVEDIVQKLQQLIRDGCTDTASSAANAETKEDEATSSAKLYTQRDALSMIQYCGTASTMAQLLQQLPASSLSPTSTTTPRRTNAMTTPEESSSAAMISNLLQVHIHADDFSTEGIKKKSAIAISLLYELGLPFQSTADGKRFRTQQQLSYHLDHIFQQKQRKNQADAASSLERGWYIADLMWTMGNNIHISNEQTSVEENPADKQNVGATENSTDPDILFTVPADESRDTCVVCGLKFVMFFDTNEGQYKYRNCREIPVDMEMESDVALENDDEPDIQFVHGTCWMGLGEPNSLSYDQTIYNAQ